MAMPALVSGSKTENRLTSQPVTYGKL